MEPIFRLPPDWSLTPVATALSEVVDPFQDFLGVADLQKRSAGKVSGRALKYAVLDTGCDLNHKDLLGQFLDAADFSNSIFGPDDRVGHGTWCAGAIAAAANDYGVRGIAYEAKLLIGKVLGDNGSGSEAAIASGLKWAYQKGADVFSLSLGGGQMSQSVHAMFAEVSQQAGKFIFCAAGNDSGSVNFPAVWPEVVAVGAVDATGHLTQFTSRGPELDILAPGVNILSTIPGNRHGQMTGTSMATPIAAAVAGLVYAEAVNSGNGELLKSVADMVAVLRKTGRTDLGNAYPLIDPRSLSGQYQPPVAPPVVPPVVPVPVIGSPIDGVIVYAGGKAVYVGGKVPA